MTVCAGDFGVVRVIAGRFKGRTGYYDDDDTEKTAIVYFGTPFESEPEFIRQAYLEKTDDAHLPLEEWLRKHPNVARHMGVEP